MNHLENEGEEAIACALILHTTGFVLCIYFQAWLLGTCDFPGLQ